MWHYEYTVDDRQFRFPAATFEGCLAEVMAARTVSPALTGVRVFFGGTMAFGSGQKQYDQQDPVTDSLGAP